MHFSLFVIPFLLIAFIIFALIKKYYEKLKPLVLRTNNLLVDIGDNSPTFSAINFKETKSLLSLFNQIEKKVQILEHNLLKENIAFQCRYFPIEKRIENLEKRIIRLEKYNI
ncbi:hypothetical protein KAH27_02450 [bacterium]|nr:hypothetical protein [bacterium]